MKIPLLSTLLLATPLLINAQITDPVVSFRDEISSPEPVVLLKLEFDLNGDGKNDVLLTRKDTFETETKAGEIPGWSFYITGPNGFSEPKGVRDQGEDVLGVGDVPMINIHSCHVGPIEELGNKQGIVTKQIDNPRVGDPVATIYAYTVEGDHLLRTELAEYNPLQPNPLFDKYLKDGKRTVITPVEVSK